MSVHKICLFDDEWKMICNKFIELSQSTMITYILLWWIHSIKTVYLFIKCESKSPNIIWSFWQSCVANAKNIIIELHILGDRLMTDVFLDEWTLLRIWRQFCKFLQCSAERLAVGAKVGNAWDRRGIDRFEKILVKCFYRWELW